MHCDMSVDSNGPTIQAMPKISSGKVNRSYDIALLNFYIFLVRIERFHFFKCHSIC